MPAVIMSEEVLLGQLESHIVRKTEELVALRRRWLELLEQSSANEPVLSPDWLLTWWDVYAAHQRRQLTTVYFTDNGRLVGLVPLTSRLARHRNVVPIRRLDPLGAGEDPEHECCACYVGVIAERGYEAAVVEGLVEVLDSSEFPSWEQLRIPEMHGESPLPALLRTALAARGYLTELRVADHTYYIPLPAHFDHYVERLSYRRRYFVRRTVRDFDKWAAGTAQLKAATTPHELQQGLSVLKQLHDERWQAVGGCGAFASQLFSGFHERVLATMLARGTAELLWLEAHGRPVAALYQILWGERALVYQAGRALDVPKGARPGIVIHLRAIARAIDRGQREYDLLCGQARYKRQLAGTARPLFELEAWRPSVAQRACHALDEAVSLTKGVIAQR